MQIQVKRLTPDATIPTRAHPGDAGLDLYAARAVSIQPGKVSLIQTGISLAIPEGHCGLICDRSSLGACGLKVMGGVIDSGYTGEVVVALAYVAPENQFGPASTSTVVKFVAAGAKVAQLLILPVPQVELIEVDDLPASERGDNGFGSTGA